MYKKIDDADDSIAINHECHVKVEGSQPSHPLPRKSIIKGCLCLAYYSKGKRRRRALKRLIAELFVENPNNYKFVRCKDKDPMNCKASNLEWVKHATPRKKIDGLKLTKEAVSHIKSLIYLGTRSSIIARRFNVSPSMICKIKSGERW